MRRSRVATDALIILAALTLPIIVAHPFYDGAVLAQIGDTGKAVSGGNRVPTLNVNGATFGTANKIGVTNSDALASGILDYATIRAQTAPSSVANNAVAFGVYSTVTNTSSTVGTTGHMVGVMGNVTDTATGRMTIYGGERRVDGRSTDAAASHSYVGGVDKGYFQAASVSDSVLIIGTEHDISITTDGSTPLAHGLAIASYVPTMVGGLTKYAYYAQSNAIFAGGGIDSPGADIASSGLLNTMSGGAVSSASTITITGNVFHVTGTTTITSVSGTSVPAGTVITIIFDGILTFTDGSNLKLAGNFTTTADDTITLVYDGTNWYEKSRSVN